MHCDSYWRRKEVVVWFGSEDEGSATSSRDSDELQFTRVKRLAV